MAADRYQRLTNYVDRELMGTQDPQTLAQSLFGSQFGGMRAPAQQYTGILDAIILDTDETNPALSTGYCRVTVPSLGATTAFGPARYPGAFAPPNGTNCVVSFIAPQVNSPTTASVRVLSLEGFSGGTSPNFVTAILGEPAAASTVGPVNAGASDISYLNLTSGVVEVSAPVAFGQTAVQTNVDLIPSSGRSTVSAYRMDGTAYLLITTINLTGSGGVWQFDAYDAIAEIGSDLSIGSDESSIVSAEGGFVTVTAQIEVQYS